MGTGFSVREQLAKRASGGKLVFGPQQGANGFLTFLGGN